MTEPIREFLQYLNEPSDLEYGDFKRRTDSHLLRLLQSSGPYTEEQMKALAQLREELIWQDHPDEEIDSIREKIRGQILAITSH